jgi:hypothetical protein
MEAQQHGSASRHAELPPLTDSLSSLVRWRLKDYENILRIELKLMVGESSPAEGRPSSRHRAPPT